MQENTSLTLDELNDVSNSRYQTFRNMIYTYDLVSGKVNTFSYDPGQADQYYYKYEYDADNRVTCAYSSTDNRQWDRDAKYFYLQHGPLYRTEIGNDKVQGVDYAYTLHGWIKGTNSNALTAAKDMGADAGSGLNAYTPLDQYGYELTYYDTTGHSDYTSITTNPAFASQSGASIQTTGKNLWNGNIKSSQSQELSLNNATVGSQSTAPTTPPAGASGSTGTATGSGKGTIDDANDPDFPEGQLPAGDDPFIIIE